VLRAQCTVLATYLVGSDSSSPDPGNAPFYLGGVADFSPGLEGGVGTGSGTLKVSRKGKGSSGMDGKRWVSATIPPPLAVPLTPPLPACLFVQHGPLRIEIRRGEEGIRCSMIPSFFLITSAPNIEHRTKAGPPRNLN
jgi:hypothetical protein